MATNLTTAMTTLFNKIVALNTNKVDTSAVNNIVGRWENLTVTCTPKSRWTKNECTAKLVGDFILVELEMTRSSSLSGGNITNEDLCDISIKTQGKVGTGWAISFNTGGEGTNASFAVSGNSLSGSGSSQVLTFTVRIAATYGSGSIFRAIFPIYCGAATSYYF